MKKFFLLLLLPLVLMAGTATDINGLYFTGGLLPAGSTDPNWSVTYASIDGGKTIDNSFLGNAYVIDPSGVAGNGLANGWINNTSNAQWITAQNAEYSTNGGGYYGLPGNGTYGRNAGIFLYTLQFNIVGNNIGSVVTNDVSISLTLAADDMWKVYLNPTGNGTTLPNSNSVIEFDNTQAWLNTTSITLDNYQLNNALFKIGPNYLVVEVDNTNNIYGSSKQTYSNASGLFLYQSSANWSKIDGIPVVPELPYTGIVIVGGSLTVWFFKKRKSKS